MEYNNIIKICKDTINSYEIKDLNYKDLLIISNKIHEKYDIKFDYVLPIIEQLFEVKYKLRNAIPDIKKLRDFEFMMPPVKINKEYKKLQKQFDKLKALPQPEQRTKEWFAYRHDRITASDTAEAIDESPYQPIEYFILKK
jgi:hypothetical protein